MLTESDRGRQTLSNASNLNKHFAPLPEAAVGDLVATLSDMVALESITGNEAAMGAYVASFCADLGFDIELVEAETGRPNVIATWTSGRPGPALLLNDHLDIVPPGPLEFWDTPPFEPTVKNGRVYGRGTIDTKSGLTTLLYSAKAALERKDELCGGLQLIFTCDEEVGGAKGMQHLGRNGYLKADLALVAEPTSMQIEIATKGRLNLEITTTGRATHAARPWLGHSAIEDMVDLVVELRKHSDDLATRHHPLVGQASLCIGTLDGGTVPNMVPNRCVMGLDRRVLPTEDPTEAKAEIQDIIDRLTSAKPGFNASMRELVWWPGYVIDQSEAVVEYAARAFEKVVGHRPEIKGKDAGTDASWIHVLGGIPVVMFSPGSGPDAMNANENVGIEDLATATKVVTQFVFDVLSRREQP